MPDVQEVFRMATQKVRPEPGFADRQREVQHHHTRRRKTGAIALVAALVTAAAVIAIRVLPDSSEEPVPLSPERPESGVAFVDLDGTIVGEIGTNGTPEMRTLMISSASNGLTLSPDGSRAVVSDGAEIFTMNLDGTGLTKLTDGEHPAWSPDGSMIAFTDQDGIHVISPDGTGTQTIVATEGSEAAWPFWSPDGQRIAYEIEGQADADHGIYVVDADGGEPTRLTKEWDSFPSWHPDGTTITFTRIGRSQDLYSVAADGSARARPLVAGPGGQHSGLWSPSDELLAYWASDVMFESDVEDIDVRVLDARTGGDRVVVEGARFIGWAPDGTLLVLF